MAHSKEKKQTETIPEKDQMAHLLEKVKQLILLKMLKELKENMKKIKMIYEQNGNIKV